MEQYKKRVNMYMMPLFCILLSRCLELVINDPLLVCAFSLLLVLSLPWTLVSSYPQPHVARSCIV